MTSIEEGGLVFQFPDGWVASKYDAWTCYRKHFQNLCDSKAVDILALPPESDGTLWLIEVKDYRHSRRQKEISIFDEMAQKVRDTLAGLLAASVNASVDEEKQFARKCCRRRRLRVVLHLEQPAPASRLFPRPFDPANVQLKLRTLLKGVDPHPRVVDRGLLPAGLGWQVDLAP
jgi:hypothetical protein